VNGFDSSKHVEPDVTPVFFDKRQERRSPFRPVDQQRTRSSIVACVDETPASSGVLRHAIAVGRGLDLPITLARVIETSPQFRNPVDPVEWQLRRNEHRLQLDRLAAPQSDEAPPIESVLLTGPAAEQLNQWAEDHRAPLLALATHGHGEPGQTTLGTTAQRMLERTSASLLLVPPSAMPTQHEIVYRRILVPLDGSCRAESVLPVAARVARAHGAEIVLVHIVPKMVLVGGRAGQPSDLYTKLSSDNELHARQYLHELCSKLRDDRLSVSVIVTPECDARAELRRLAIDQQIDLIVLSSHGQSGLADVPCGSVTEYLANHAPSPILIVRPSFIHGFGEAPSGPTADVGFVAN
jgi:nucleotide-binding universal stress UspA family protein